MNKKWIPALTGVAALAIGFFASVQLGLSPVSTQTAYPLAGQTFETPQGTALDMAALKGKTVVVNFWATWCPPCVEEMPELNALYPELKAKNIELIGIAIDSPSNVKQFLEKTPVDYTVVLGGLTGTELAKKLGNTQGGLPYTVVLNADGEKILTKAGRIHADEIKAALTR
ncbi:MAG TPA: TlpA disulfide reductase family protein [Limnobacter sp.]|uniref:TlpA family protein disulfide reductase n=1 Tax=Limnobacter sp. TaxID=2003368 RepID=UPI002ED819EB